MSKVFISYRGNDSAGYAYVVYHGLLQHFSKDQLFMDVDTVEPGVDFISVIEEAVGKCDAHEQGYISSEPALDDLFAATK